MINTGKKPVETYTWICADQQCDTIDCYKSPDNRQTVCKLWSVAGASDSPLKNFTGHTDEVNSVVFSPDGT